MEWLLAHFLSFWAVIKNTVFLGAFTKYKNMEPAVKFIRAKLMEARAQSEARQDLDSIYK